MASKKYTVSYPLFNSKKAALEQIKEWDENGELRSGTRVFEITKTFEAERVYKLKEIKK